jgi:2-phospho-L-lactate transferase/gluconeogenesis factor (CofD/UPF0052 family)
MQVTLIAGGVGGARMALALHEALEPGELTVIGNVGDDCEHWGLSISPDLDTVLVAVGGGGLIGGMAAWYQGRVRVVAVESEGLPGTELIHNKPSGL